MPADADVTLIFALFMTRSNALTYANERADKCICFCAYLSALYVKYKSVMADQGFTTAEMKHAGRPEVIMKRLKVRANHL